MSVTAGDRQFSEKAWIVAQTELSSLTDLNVKPKTIKVQGENM